MRSNPSVPRWRSVAAVLAALSLLLAACGDDDDAATTEPGAEGDAPGDAGAGEIDRDAEFRYGIHYGHNSFDPHRTPSYTGDQVFQRQVYDRLLTLERDADGNVSLAPQLATEYVVADDGTSVEFTLRDDVTFQDGEPFDAEAVVANIERALDPDSTVASLLANVSGAEAVDATTVVLNLSQPDPSVPWLMATNTTGMMASPAAFDDLAAAPVGTGPYRLVSAQRDAEVVYERWDDHWDPDAAQAQRLVVSTVHDLNARYNGVRAGDLHAADLGTPIDGESRAMEDEGYHWIQVLSPITVGLMMNADMEPFDDVRVRRAVSMAIDRSEVSEGLTNGVNPPAYQPFTAGYLGHVPELDEDPYDPEAARALIEEAGADGAKVRMIQPTSPPQEQLSVVLQQALGDIGLEVELLPISGTEGRPTWRERGHVAMAAPIIAEVDPGATLGVSYLGADNPGTPPEELVQLAAEAAALPAQSAEQAEAYQAISKYLVENPVHVPMLQWSTVILARPEVVGADRFMVTGIADLDFRGIGVSGT